MKVPDFHAASHAERHRNQDCQDDGQSGHRNRRLQPLPDELGHRHVREDGNAEIALGKVADPAHELDVHWLIQPEPLPDLHDVGRARIVAGDDRRGIAGGEVEEQEDEDPHHRHHRDGGHDPTDYVAVHIGYRTSVTEKERCDRDVCRLRMDGTSTSARCNCATISHRRIKYRDSSGC